MRITDWLKLGLAPLVAVALLPFAPAALADEPGEEALANAAETPAPGPEATEATEAAERQVPRGLEEIRVTGRKKADVEALQEVPIAVSAFTGLYLEENFVENLTDLSRSAPNVQLTDNATFAGTASFSIRGNAIFSDIVSDEPLVGIFVDGIYAGMNVGAIHDLFEVEMVEILRGPQGTLFGRNVTGGAIIIRTRRPSGEFGVRGRFTVGSFSRSDGALTVEAPINESLSWKLDLLSKDRNGMWDTPNIGGKTGNATSWTFRPMLSWQPTDTLDIQALYEVMRYTGDGTPVRLAVDGGPNNGLGCQAIPCDPATDPKFPTKGEIGAFDLQQDWRGDQGYKVQRATVEANWDVGPGVLTSITGWRHVVNETSLDVDGTPLDHFQGGPSSPRPSRAGSTIHVRDA